ncbi:uncharacterized protein LOC129565625 [Sitodiplosis mosellana]|uniref:uncharacterized protein LOC129565625 n=1 Tax=Sitodiplosis mosellana TaxID=263140 RepID=UPI0024438B06|nr:uncharacterized protein LOC129565625 [Sitodiplosis mosellana]
MFEFEDNLSTGFHDVFLSKYSDASCPILDLYISDSMQDMLDIDIRTEVATVVGGASEFSSLMSELPTLDFETSNDGETPWLGGPKWSSTSSSHDMYADVGACVNPNSVMPAINNINAGLTSRTLTSDVLNSPKSQLDLNTNTFKPSSSPLPSPKEKKSHLTFSPNIIKVPVVQESKKQSLLCQAQRTNVEAIKKDLSSEIMKDEKIFTQFKPTITSMTPSSTPTNTIKLAPGIGGLTFANSLAFAKLKNNSNTKIVTSNGNVITTAQQLKNQHIRSSSPSQNINNNITIINNNNNDSNHFHRKIIDDSPKVTSEGFKFVVQNGKGTLIATTSNGLTSSVNTTTLSSMQQHAIANGTALKPQPLKLKIAGPEFPKPAYSYSCLIAMALKNSRAGSLPVSEIYSFMCEHFPYFKTAPNGWKNSVRHNLSLNKCFEKIEKPATNGGQRKGCLWAMNPSKIAKMDEEVQKWSRKDPMAIRKAMVIPENLPALERGEMKHGSLNDSDVEPDDTEDSEPENELEDSIVNGIVPDVDSCDEENSQIENEYDLDVSDMFDEVDIEDSKSIQFALNTENGQTEFFESEVQPAAKRARLDINCSIAPARTFSISNNGTAQIIQKTSFAGHVQHQLLQQQQNRRKVMLVNRTA